MKHMRNKLTIFLRGGGQKEIKDMNRQELLEYLQYKNDSLAYENDINTEWLKRKHVVNTQKETISRLVKSIQDDDFKRFKIEMAEKIKIKNLKKMGALNLLL